MSYYAQGQATAKDQFRHNQYQQQRGVGNFQIASASEASRGLSYDSRFDEPDWLHYKLSPKKRGGRKIYNKAYKSTHGNPITHRADDSLGQLQRSVDSQLQAQKSPRKPYGDVRKSQESPSVLNNRPDPRSERARGGRVARNSKKNQESSSMLNSFDDSDRVNRPSIANMYTQGLNVPHAQRARKNQESASVFNDVIATEKSRPHQLTSKKNVESSSVWHPDRVSYDVHHEQRQGGRRRQIKAGRESDSMFNPQPNVQRRTFVVDAKKNKESASILNTLPQDNYRHETGGRFKTSLRNQETASMFNSRPQPAQPRAVQKGSKNKSHLFTNADTYKPPQPALKVSQKNFESASMFNGKQPATARGRGRAVQGNLSNRESSDMFQYQQQQQPHSARGSNNNNNNGGYVSDYNGGRKHLSQRHKDNQVIISPGPGSYADRLDSFRQGFKDFTKVPMKGGVRNNRNQSSFNIVSDGREQYRSQRYYNQPYTARY